MTDVLRDGHYYLFEIGKWGFRLLLPALVLWLGAVIFLPGASDALCWLSSALAAVGVAGIGVGFLWGWWS